MKSCSCILAVLAATTTFGGQAKPNILFIFTDDQSYETVAALGNTEIVTPNMDRLAESGVSFTNTYNMGGWGGAICVASRTMMITGRSVWRAQQAHRSLEEAADRRELWPQLLEQAGYETYFTGKWHVNIDPDRVFQHQVHERPGMPPDSRSAKRARGAPMNAAFYEDVPGYLRPVEGVLDVWSPYARSFGGFWEGGRHWSEVLADDATAFLEQAAQSEKPFFMYLAFNAPHDPRQSPKRFVDLYPKENIAIPASYQPAYPYKDQIGCSPLLRDEALAPFPRTEYAVRTHRQEYYAIISHMDEQIGRILEALEASGKQDNTYIILSSDHGLACGNHGLMGKQNMYEHSLKPPLILVGPDLPENERRDALVYLQDIMATTLDWAGVEKPAFVEFQSLLPLVQDPENNRGYEAVYGAYLHDAQRMIRKGGMKLIVYPKAAKVRLFNLVSDPDEIRDLSGNPEAWPTVRELFRNLLEEQAKVDDTLPLADHFPELR